MYCQVKALPMPTNLSLTPLHMYPNIASVPRLMIQHRGEEVGSKAMGGHMSRSLSVGQTQSSSNSIALEERKHGTRFKAVPRPQLGSLLSALHAEVECKVTAGITLKL